MSPIIQVEGLRKHFGDTAALDNLDLVVEPGQVFGLLGPNGAGKTTLVRILATLVTPDSGSVRVAGYDLATDPVGIRSTIGLAGQFAAVDEELTGRENLEIVGRCYRVGRREAKHRAQTVLERLELGEVADRPARTYSGGTRRRLDLGASLVGRPAVLLLDEPTTGLDPRTRLQLWSSIDELVGDGTSVLLTTQYLEEADRLAANVAVIDHGRIIAQGTPRDLKRQVGDDVVVVALEHASDLTPASIAVADATGEAVHPDADNASITVSAPHGVTTLGAVIRAIDRPDISVLDVSLRRPSLDDVFLSLTGNPSDDDPTDPNHDPEEVAA